VGWGGQYLADRGAKRERWLRPKSAARALVVGGDSNEFSSINCPELWESLREEGVPVQDDPSVFRSSSLPPLIPLPCMYTHNLCRPPFPVFQVAGKDTVAPTSERWES
jgi:hypothetical protein